MSLFAIAGMLYASIVDYFSHKFRNAFDSLKETVKNTMPSIIDSTETFKGVIQTAVNMLKHQFLPGREEGKQPQSVLILPSTRSCRNMESSCCCGICKFIVASQTSHLSKESKYPLKKVSLK